MADKSNERIAFIIQNNIHMRMKVPSRQNCGKSYFLRKIYFCSHSHNCTNSYYVALAWKSCPWLPQKMITLLC